MEHVLGSFSLFYPKALPSVAPSLLAVATLPLLPGPRTLRPLTLQLQVKLSEAIQLLFQ